MPDNLLFQLLDSVRALGQRRVLMTSNDWMRAGRKKDPKRCCLLLRATITAFGGKAHSIRDRAKKIIMCSPFSGFCAACRSGTPHHGNVPVIDSKNASSYISNFYKSCKSMSKRGEK